MFAAGWRRRGGGIVVKPSLGVVVVLVVALAAAGVNGEDLSSMQVVLEGDHVVGAGDRGVGSAGFGADDAGTNGTPAGPANGTAARPANGTTGGTLLVVGGGTATVPPNATHNGSVYVVEGLARVHGRVRGDVVVVSGRAVLGAGAVVTGDLQVVGGEAVDFGASVGGRRQTESRVVETATRRGPLPSLLGDVGLALVAVAVVRRRPALLANVADAAADHPVVGLTVGGLTTAAGVALLVLMAFTIVLIPLSILGALAGVVAVAYGYLGLGHLAGRRLPVARRDVATGAGTLGVGVLLDALPVVPVVGGLVALAVSLLGLGAVVVTYFGVVPFEPPSLS